MPDDPGLYFKAVLTSAFSAVILRLGALSNLLWLFIAAVTLDYITGVLSAVYHHQLCSSIGYKGILKKIGECIVIAVALICDDVVSQATGQWGTQFSTGGVIAVIVTVWLILNELISILENLAHMDIALPPFLLKAISFLKKQAEDKGERLETGDGEKPEEPQS